MRSLLKAHFPILFLVLLEVVIFLTNYIPGTFLVGWDNTMPEFNLKLNLFRSIYSLWQEYRGLGLLDGMAHAANLPHTIYIAILSVFLPQNILRYVFIHLTHLFGGISMFYLLASLFAPQTSPHPSPKRRGSILSFVGALFYMLNLGVIQQFYAPLEVFTVHFVALPLIALLVINVFKKPSKRNYFFLFLGSLAVSPQGFVPTVFIAFFIMLFSLLTCHFFYTKRWKQTVLVGFIVLAANAFWLMPYAYSALYTPQVIKQAKINQFSSEEIFYRNKAHGDLWSVLTLSGFMIDAIEMDTTTTRDVFFMEQWRTHTQSIPYKIVLLGCILTMMLGIYAAIRHREHMLTPYLLAGGVAFFFLANNTLGLEQLNNLVRTIAPIVGEAFRFPFTKFIILFAFCYSIFFTYGLLKLLLFFEKHIRIRQKNLVYSLSGMAVCLGLLFLSLPAFFGNFTSPFLRLRIPEEYLQAFSYFNTIPENNRVAILPVHTFWNWQYRDWQFRGSGFHWFGIPQPTLHRAFDPWSGYNEQVYNELAYATERNDIQSFERVLQKYDISYLLLDRHTVNALTKKPIDFNRIDTFLLSSQKIQKEQSFGGLEIYKTSVPSEWVTTIPEQDVLPVYPPSRYTNQDTLLTTTNTYVGDIDAPAVIKPFSSFYTERAQEEQTFSVKETADSFELTTKLDFRIHLNGHELTVPSIASESLIPIEIRPVQQGILIIPLYPQLRLNDKEIPLPQTAVSFPTTVRNPQTFVLQDIQHTLRSTRQPLRTYLLRNQINTLTVQNGNQEEDIYIDPAVFPNDELVIPLEDQTLSSFSMLVPKISSPLAQQNVVISGTYKTLLREEDALGTSPYSYRKAERTEGGILLEARKSSSEVAFYHSKLPHQASYLIHVTADHESGLPATFYVDNPIHVRAEHDAKLSTKGQDNYFIIPPTESYFQGYGFHMYVRSVGKEIARTTLQGVSYYPFPETWASNLSIQKPSVTDATANTTEVPLSFTKLNPALYTVDMSINQSPTPNSYLLLSQAYDPGWQAYRIQNSKFKVQNWIKKILPFLFGRRIPEHVLINNWQNGWELSAGTENQTVVLLYVPQLTQYLGILLTLGTGVWLLLKRKLL